MTFCGKEEQGSGRMAYFFLLKAKNKPEQRELCSDVERVKGIEPSYSAWEADVLPLNYTRMDRTTMILAHSAEKIKRGEGKKTDRIVKNCKRGHRGSALSSRILKRNRGRRVL